MKYLLNVNLWYIPELGALYQKKKKKEEEEEEKRAGQYNSNN